MGDQPGEGISDSPRFRGYSDELRHRFGELSAAFYDCQRTFAAIIDVNAAGPTEGSAARLEHDYLEQDPQYPAGASALVPLQSYFYLSTAAEHLGGLGLLYAAEEVAYPPSLLIRAVVEHTSRVVWLLDNEIEVDDRVARAYLEELFSQVEYKKTIGRLVGKDSEEYKAASAALLKRRKEVQHAFGEEKIVDAKGDHLVRGQSLPRLGQCVASLIGKLTATAPLPDPRGVYDRVSNLCHPTVYTHMERWEVVEEDGRRTFVSTVSASDHDRPASLAMAAFCEALRHLISYNEWDRSGLESLIDRLPSPS
jgi:hypothetical protein